jgi:hypothetical protein
MLSFITFKYLKPGYRTVYTAEHVNALMEMVARCYQRPHRFFCVTDDPEGIDGAVETVPMWDDHFDLINPSHPTSRPNCYPRLKLFSPEMRDIFGERFVSLDLDMVMTGDVTPLFDRPEPFVIYDARGDDHYNGSIFMQTAGAHPEIWDDFCPVRSPQLTTAANMKGSDQAWIRYKLSPHAATWSYEEGVYAYLNLVPPRRQLRRGTRQTHGGRRRMHTHGPVTAERDGSLPKNARIVVFAGEYKPWEARTQEISPWIRSYYPLAGQ